MPNNFRVIEPVYSALVQMCVIDNMVLNSTYSVKILLSIIQIYLFGNIEEEIMQ